MKSLCIILVLIIQANCLGQYYKLLNLSPDATKQQIRKAYREMTIKYHPELLKQEKNKCMFLI